MERRLTPTGHLILSADAPREAWLRSRLEGITATDLPAILGLNKYKTAIDVWMEKVTPFEDSFEPAIGSHEAAFWGIALEDTVAKTWAEHAGLHVRRVGILNHIDLPWMRASLDRLVTGCPDGRCGLEVKTRSGYVADEWARGVPADVAAQVHWQLLVSGLDHIHVIALIGGQKLVEHRVSLEGVDGSQLIGAALMVWEAVKSGQPPQMPEAMWTNDYLEQLHPDRSGELEVEPSVLDTAIAYQNVVEQIRELDGRKNELKTLLIGALGEHETATSNGRSVYSYKSSTRRSLNQKALADIYPDVVTDDRVWSSTTSRTLRLSTQKESD